MEAFLQNNLWILALLMIWVLPWKGYALWSAAELKHKWWFVALLVLNTIALLDIVYIFFIARPAKKKVSVQNN